MRLGRTLVGIFIFRVLIATLLLQTYFHADEWYQSTEVAYKYVHTKSTTAGSTSGAAVVKGSRADVGAEDVKLTWEWDHKIRSFAFPFPFAAVFRLGQVLGIDTAAFYWYSPKILVALIATIGDWQLYRLAEELFGGDVARDSLILSLLCWWNSFHMRTLANIVEGVMLTCCLRPKISHRTFFLLVAIGCCLRITFVIPVLFPALQILSRSVRAHGPIVFLELCLMVLLGLGFVVTTDYLYYGEVVVTPWRFLEFNLIQGLSKHFGTHPIHWYFSNALPTVLGAHLVLLPAALGFQPPPFLLKLLGAGAISGESYRVFVPVSLPRRYQTGFVTLVVVTILTLGLYSLIPHKEFRFIDAIVPVLMILLALPFTYSIQWRRGQIKRRLLSFLTIGSVVLFVIFGVLHQRGTLAAVDYLRNTLPPLSSEEQPLQHQGVVEFGEKNIVHCLMGCHSLPGYSALHDRVPPRGLVQADCWLQVNPDTQQLVPTEHHLFYKNPVAFTNFVYLRKTPSDDAETVQMLHELQHGSSGFQGFRQLPERFVVYHREAELLKDTLLQPEGSYPHYELEQSFFHTFFIPEDSMDYTVEIWRKKHNN